MKENQKIQILKKEAKSTKKPWNSQDRNSTAVPWLQKLMRLYLRLNFISNKWENTEQYTGKAKMLQEAKTKVELVYKWKKCLKSKKKTIAIKYYSKIKIWNELKMKKLKMNKKTYKKFSTFAIGSTLTWILLVKICPNWKISHTKLLNGIQMPIMLDKTKHKYVKQIILLLIQ